MCKLGKLYNFKKIYNQKDLIKILTWYIIYGYFECGRSRPAVACWTSDHWVAGSNPLKGMFHH